MANETSLVIGAAGGVGLELVKQLVDGGHRVLGSVLSDAEEAYVLREIPSVSLLRLDLSQADHVVAQLAPVLAALPEGLNNVIVAAGISPYGPLETTPLAKLRQTLEINTVGALAVYQACIPFLRLSQGRLILLSSIAGKVALPFVGHYTASKFALEGLADVMRRECARWGVTVIVAEPGGIHTPMVLNQIKAIAHDRENLTPFLREVYGQQYESFEGLLKSSLVQSLSPATVAKAITNSLLEAKPKARYPVGDAAVYLCGLASRLPDEELDVIVAQFTSGGTP